MDLFDAPPRTSPTTTSSPASAAMSLPTRADVKTQETLMAESILAIETRGKAKFDQLNAEREKRESAAQQAERDAEAKMIKEAQAELKQHVATRDQAVAAAKKTHAEAQSQLLKETKSLENKGSVWQLAATHSDLSKPNTRAQKSTDRMRKLMGSLAETPNVPIGKSAQ